MTVDMEQLGHLLREDMADRLASRWLEVTSWWPSALAELPEVVDAHRRMRVMFRVVRLSVELALTASRSPIRRTGSAAPAPRSGS